eukprot:15457062-Alexandrium_andersonii.AAC.1
MHKRFRHSKLELRGNRNDLKLHPGRSRLGGSASFCALIPNLTTRRAARGGPECFLRGSEG